MKSRVILSALGRDRPGLTRMLADAVFAAGGNWLESHLSHLGGNYVGAVLVELEGEAIPRLEEATEAISAEGLHVSIVPADAGPARPVAPLLVEVVGQDRPGIVREVTAVLTRLQANIEDLSTVTEHSAWSGDMLFRAAIRLSLPAGTSSEDVRAALEAISGEIMVDFSVAGSEAQAQT